MGGTDAGHGLHRRINYILNQVPKNHQTGCSPHHCLRRSSGLVSVTAQPSTIFIDSDELSVDTVDQKIVQLEEDDKFRALCSFLREDLISRGSCSARQRFVATDWPKLCTLIATSHGDHGDLSQRQRDMAIQAFRTGKTGL